MATYGKEAVSGLPNGIFHRTGFRFRNAVSNKSSFEVRIVQSVVPGEVFKLYRRGKSHRMHRNYCGRVIFIEYRALCIHKQSYI